MADNSSRIAPATLAALAIIGGGIANWVLAPRVGTPKVAAWLLTVAMIVLLGMCIGKAINGRWDGVLVNARNRVSLPRLQMCGWTLLILSGLITGAASNLVLPGGDALAIDIQNELLAAMGIAAITMAATPAILSLKTGNGAGPGIATRATSDDAKWLDMFRGDEDADQDMPDLSKIQQFLITLALIGAYAVELGNMLMDLGSHDAFRAFPILGEKAIWLLAISHAGYLGYKAATKPGASPSGNGGLSATTATTPSPPLPPPPV